MRVLAASLFLLLPFTALADRHVGRRAPGFSLPDININYHDLADYRGKVILLDFIQTSCPKCQTSQKIYETIRLKYPDKVAVLSVVVPPDTQQTVRQFMNQWSIKTPVLFDCGQVTASYYRATPQNPTITFPQVFVIDGNGVIKGHHEFAAGQEHWFEQLDPLLKEVESIMGGKAAPAGPARPAGPAAPAPAKK